MKPEFFKSNRHNLIAELNGGLVVMTAYSKMQLSGDSAATFEQEANFWWLTGIEASDWWLIVDGFAGKSWLVMPTVSENHQLFDGSLQAGDALRSSGVDAVIDRDEAVKKMAELARRHKLVYTLGDPPYAKYADFTLNPAMKKLRKLLERTFTSVQDCRREISRLRAIKQPAELKAIESAVTLSIDAFRAVNENLKSYKYEYEVEAELTYSFNRRGATHAFEPIVASGKNACTLHYIENKAPLGKQRMVLIDAGARVDGYPADITRTYSVGGPTRRQVEVHAAVRDAERQIINLLKPDVLLVEYSRGVDEIMKDALISLGLIRSRDDEEGYRRYFPHSISHGLGVDVHDSLGGWTYLLPGMVLTVEPGIYIPEEGIGVRIEDDILVTKNGIRNLTGGLSTDMNEASIV